MKKKVQRAESVVEALRVIAKRLRDDGRPEGDVIDDIALALRDIVLAQLGGDGPDERDVRRVTLLSRKLRSSDIPEIRGLASLLRRIASEPIDSSVWRDAADVVDDVADAFSGDEAWAGVVRLAEDVLDKLNRMSKMYSNEPWFVMAGDVMYILSDFIEADQYDKIPDFTWLRDRKVPRELRRENPASYKLLMADWRLREKLMDALMALYKNKNERTAMVAERIIRSLPKIYRKLWSDMSDVYGR